MWQDPEKCSHQDTWSSGFSTIVLFVEETNMYLIKLQYLTNFYMKFLNMCLNII